MSDEALIAAAREAATHAYAPYSKFHVGAALRFADGSVITGSNVENASYGLTLCAETVAVGKALSEPWRGALEAVAVFGGPVGEDGAVGGTNPPVTPCGRCRQMLNEVAALGGSDPTVLCIGSGDSTVTTLSALLPHAFGPASLG